MTTPNLNPINANLHGKTAVITAAGGVMCSYFSRVLAAAGANVAMLDIDENAVNKACDIVLSEGGTAKAYTANALRKDSLEEAHSQILKDFGLCSILINGAGGNNPRGNTQEEYFLDESSRSFYDITADDFNYVFNLNLTTALLTSQVFSIDMIGHPGCSILNISSMNAIKPLTKLPAYSAAKAGISNFTQWLAVYFSKAGIRVNALAPGFFITKQNRPNLIGEDGAYTPRAYKILEGTPMRRFGDISELASLMLLLVNEETSSFITGTVIPVDGGFDAYCGV